MADESPLANQSPMADQSSKAGQSSTTDQSSKDQTFYLGICMAGAVSAGSYTAGVMDFLLEALEEWQKRSGQDGVPTHKVEIPVMGGASAGGMTGIITAAGLQQGIQHVKQPLDDAHLLDEHPESILYHTWVDLTSPDMFPELLKTSDVAPGAVYSVLNAQFIDDIAKRVITPPDTTANKTWATIPSFFSPRLKIFTTLTNLQGFLYNVAFNADGPSKTHPYYMQIHNDYACFELTDDRTPEKFSDDGMPEKLKADGTPIPFNGWMPLNIPGKVNTDVAINAAMATGAFPVGLKAKLLQRRKAYVNENPLQDGRLKLEPETAEPYTSLNVDGGMINNEPFDKVREVLDLVSNVKDPSDNQDFNLFSSTVLMIAPFPSSKPDEISTSQDLQNVIGLTLSSMLSQMRSKPINLVNAMDSNCAGQYLIAPSRRVPKADGSGEENIQGEKAIACGSLDGFGGFLNKEFRVHDYFLGRYNCQIFLRDYFTIPASAVKANPIFKAGYAGIKDPTPFQSKVDGSYQIIPVFFEAGEPVFPSFKFASGGNWPVLEWSAISEFKGPLKSRVQAILLNIKKFNAFYRIALWIGAWLVLNRIVSQAVLGVIKKRLTDWHLLKVADQAGGNS
jgi:hypothetical protein